MLAYHDHVRAAIILYATIIAIVIITLPVTVLVYIIIL